MGTTRLRQHADRSLAELRQFEFQRVLYVRDHNIVGVCAVDCPPSLVFYAAFQTYCADGSCTLVLAVIQQGAISMSNLRIGDEAPDFEAQTTQGTIKFHEWLGDSWGVLFSHPKDFTPVCTTELGYMARINPEFQKRNVKIIGLSVDPVDNHAKWADDIEETQGFMPNYPMIGDTDLNVAKLYGMLPAGAGESFEGRTAVDNQTVRTVFVIGPDKKIKLSISYPMSTGRNFDEILRVIDSMQLTAKHKVATPVNWKDGDDVIIVPAVSNEEAEKQYPDGWKTLKPYLRVVQQPK